MTKNASATMPYGTTTISFQGDAKEFIKRGGQKILAQQSLALNAELQSALLSSKGMRAAARGGAGSPVGSSTTTTPAYTFRPIEIVYYRLQATDSFTFSYASGGGIYRYANNLHPTTPQNGTMILPNDLLQFWQGVQDGDPSEAVNLGVASDVYNATDTLANMLFKNQCYVVVELISSMTLSFQAGVPAVETIGDMSKYYQDINHIDNQGNNTGASSSATVPCKLFYLSVDDPDKLRTMQDQFNYYFQNITPNGVDYTTVDPFIKNRGTKPPQLLPLAKPKKSKTSGKRKRNG